MDLILGRPPRRLQPRPWPRPSLRSFSLDKSILKLMVRAGLLASLLAAAVVAASGTPSDLQPDLQRLLAGDLKFSAGDISDLQQGKIVKHTLPATAPGEVAAVGAVRVNAPKERFLTAYRDIVRFKRNEDVLQIGRVSNPPELSDLDGLSITKEDFDLRNCRVGD